MAGRRALALFVVVACGGKAPSSTISGAAPVEVAPAAPPAVAPLAAPGKPLVAPPALELGPTPSDPAVELVGRDDVCARLASGAVACWGASFPAVTRMPWSDATALSIGESTCVRHRDGSAECGALAHGAFTRQLRVDRDVDEVFAGERIACVVQKGAVSCAQAGRPLQKIGNLGGASHLVVHRAGDGMEGEALVDLGCALVKGRVSCFRVEYRVRGEAIVGARIFDARPVAGIEGATGLFASTAWGRVCAEVARGVACVRIDIRGKAGPVETSTRADETRGCEIAGDRVTCMMSPANIPMESHTVELPQPTQALEGGPHACAIFAHGRVACWGSNESHGLGRETPATNTQPVLGLRDAIDIDGVDGRMFAVRSNGQLVAWGRGAKDAGYKSAPYTLSSVTDAVSVVVTGSMGCVLRRGDRVSCWHVSDGDVHEIDAGRGATKLVGDRASILARIGTRWKRIHSNVPPTIEEVPELDGASDATRDYHACIRDPQASTLRCSHDGAQVVFADVVAWATAPGGNVGDPSEYLALRHADARVEVVGLESYSGPIHVQRIGVVSTAAREVFTADLDLCVRDTSGEVRCGRGGAWKVREAPPHATKVMVHQAGCGLMPDHTVLCTGGDPWLFGTGVASSESPVRIAL